MAPFSVAMPLRSSHYASAKRHDRDSILAFYPVRPGFPTVI